MQPAAVLEFSEKKEREPGIGVSIISHEEDRIISGRQLDAETLLLALSVKAVFQGTIIEDL